VTVIPVPRAGLRLSRDDVSDLARTGGGATTLATLRTGQRSRRLLLLREVIIAARNHPAAVHAARLAHAVTCLDSLQRQRSAAVGQLLDHPLVGAWAAHCLRRLRSPDPAGGAVPLWVDLAHLNAVAGAAGIRAGAGVDIDVPVRDGAAALPGLGVARLPGGSRFGIARLHGDADRYVVERLHHQVVVPHPTDPSGEQDGGDWLPLRRWVLEQGERRLNVVLDDLDPYRDCHGLQSAGRLALQEARDWHRRLAEAWQVLCDGHPHRAAELSAAPLVIVPLVGARSGPGVNGTARDSTGAVAMSPPVDGVDLAQSLVHEFQHSKLGALLDLVDLYEPDDERRFYSPWRPDPRPLGGLLQAVYAFLAVADFWRRQLEAGDEPRVALAQYKLARSEQQLATALQTLRQAGTLTDAGWLFTAELTEAVRTVHQLPLPQAVRTVAAVVNEHHRLSWRLRNRMPQQAVIGALAEAFLAGFPPDRHLPASSCAATAAQRYDVEPLDDLARGDRADTLAVARSPRHARDVTGDRALLDGDHRAASAAYLAELAADPGSSFAWAGLALARQHDPAAAGPVYRDAPEVIAAVTRELRRRLGDGAPPPDAVARWLAR